MGKQADHRKGREGLDEQKQTKNKNQRKSGQNILLYCVVDDEGKYVQSSGVACDNVIKKGPKRLHRALRPRLPRKVKSSCFG
jgi:hypothetical protein